MSTRKSEHLHYYIIYAEVNNGPYTNICTSGQSTFLAPLTFDMGAIVAAGRSGGYNPFAANAVVGHYGTFDYQRVVDAAGNTTFYSGFTDASNFAVGAYLYGTGVSEGAATMISNAYAAVGSSNAGDPNQALYRNAGYESAASGGQVSCSRFPWVP